MLGNDESVHLSAYTYISLGISLSALSSLDYAPLIPNKSLHLSLSSSTFLPHMLLILFADYSPSRLRVVALSLSLFSFFSLSGGFDYAWLLIMLIGPIFPHFPQFLPLQ